MNTVTMPPPAVAWVVIEASDTLGKTPQPATRSRRSGVFIVESLGVGVRECGSAGVRVARVASPCFVRKLEI